MKKSQGFTLIELMVSISIIAILTALATISFSAAQKKARDARRTQDIKLLQLAAEQYAAQAGGVYPGTTSVPWAPVAGQSVLDAMPFEPKGGGYSGYSILMAGASNAYCACATMENVAAGNATSIGAGGSGCVFSGNTGPYFCAKNQQ